VIPLALEARKIPRQRRARATLEAIVEAAARILETDGAAGFNTNAVARRAGVSVGSLYQYFPGKQALVAELSRRNAEAALKGLAEAAQRTAGQPILLRLRAFVRFAIAQQAERPRLSRVLDQLEEALPLPTDAAATTSAIVVLLTQMDARMSALVAGDCLATARTLIDRALDAGEPARAGLEDRVVGALAGYLAAADTSL
jgi:AcrR family transcriptional regulator